MNRYIGNKIQKLDEILTNIKPTDSIKRVPRAASERSFWKGDLVAYIYDFMKYFPHGTSVLNYNVHFFKMVLVYMVCVSLDINDM